MKLIVRTDECQEYSAVWQAMQRFTEQRKVDSLDELWLLQHAPVYTQGLNGKDEHIIDPGGIPVIRTDRGGQATYHGPGQLMIYAMIDLRRKGLGIRALVNGLEQTAITVLKQYGLTATKRAHAPGVYLGDAKIASVGLRVRRGCSYHGLSLNVRMDLVPFLGINPCGYEGLKVTQLSDYVGPVQLHEVSIPVIAALMENLGYTDVIPLPPSNLYADQNYNETEWSN